MKKRILSTILSLCMVLSLLPARVLAQELTHLSHAVVQETALRSVAVQNIGPNEAEVELDLYEKMSAQVSVIKLISDIELSGSLQIDYAVTIDLNGHVLKMGDIADGSVIKVNDGGHLTIIDSVPDAAHKFTPNADGLWVLDETGGTKAVCGGVITGGTGSSIGISVYGGGVYVDGGGTFTMNGGNIVGCTASATFQARGGGVYVDGGGTFTKNGGTFTMNGGSITGCTTVAGYSYGGGIYNEGTATLSGTAEIRDCHAKDSDDEAAYGGGISDNGGTFEISGNVRVTGCTAGGGKTDAVSMDTGSVISGGTFDGSVLNSGTISGGTFNGRVYSSNMITNGTFNGDVVNDDGATISGGTFNGTVTNYGTITKGAISGVTLTYQLNGEDYATQIVQSGNAATPIYPIIDAGQVFEGWLKADGTRWDFTTAVTENTTLTGWVYVPVTNETELKAALAKYTMKVIRLTDDIDIGSSLTILHKLTLDLNGHVLKMTGSGSVIILDDNNGMTTGNLTLIDSNPTAEHKFKVNGVEPWVPDDSGTETVYGGIITGGNAENGGGVNVKKGGKFTMTAGNIVGCTAMYGGGLYLQESSFTMNGGSIVGCSSTRRIAGEPLFSGIYSTGTNFNVYTENPNVITLTGGLIKNNGRLAIDASYNTIIYANGGEIYGKVGVYQACKITGLAGKTGVTAFRGWTEVKGASNIPENISHVDWGLFYGGLGIFDDTTTGIIVTYKDGDNEYAKQALPSAGLATCPDALGDKTGYTFGGWERADGTAWDFTKDTVTENITLSAKWIPHTYTVTFDSTGGSEVTTKTMTATYGKPLANMPVPRREGYVFLGWYDAMVGGKCYGDSDGNGTDAYDKDGNITLYAQWMEAPLRMVYFNTCGGTMTGPTEVLHKTNTPIAKPDNPTKVGYTFTGWYTDSAFTQAWNFDDWVTGELRLYAGWKVKRYTITFDTAGGSKIESITQDYGTTITTPANPTREGYTFIGWNKEVPETMPAENVAITAQWKINQYTITFDTAGGSKIASITQDYGTTITAPANPIRKGYTFINWDKKIPTTMPAEDITITAQWKDIEKPTGEVRVGTSKWKTFLNNITFGLFFKDTQTVTIAAADNSSETVKIEYLLSAKEYTKAELDGMTFTAYTAPFGINPDNEYIIYVRLTDKTGNTDYICSDGIVLDGTIPVIGGIENGKTYCAAQTVTVDEKYIYTVIVNRTKVTLDKNNSFILSAADGEQKIVVTDEAGNKAEMTVTVNNGHTFGEWQPNGDGTHTHRCKISGCNGFETKECSGGTATCTEKAKCEVCHENYGEKNPANHDGGKQEWTKTETAHEKKWNCCGVVTVASEPHEWSDGVCSECGYECLHTDDDTNHICDICGKIYSNHEDTDKNHICDYCGKVITNHTGGKATCKDKAVCDYCGKSYGELDASNHANLKHVPAKAATKDAEGNIEYWYCEGCDKYYSDAEATKGIVKGSILIMKLTDEPKSPKTGDSNSHIPWAALLFIGGGVCTAITLKRRKARLTRR